MDKTIEQKPISTRLARFHVALIYMRDPAKIEKLKARIAKERREIAAFCKKENEDVV